MPGRIGRLVETGVALALLTGALTGCPKTPARPGAEGPGTGARPQAIGPASGTSGSSGSGGATGASAASPAVASGGMALPALPSPADFRDHAILRDIHFDFDRATVRAQDVPVLDTNARWLTAHPAVVVLVEGHADERGTNEYNLALGQERAKTTRDQLVARGIAPSRITVITYGEERPVCQDRAEGCWARNRRAHFLTKP